MNATHLKRLNNVIVALEEAPVPRAFNMGRYIYDTNESERFDCGTPACALGHYAARTDLQKAFKIVLEKDVHGRVFSADICDRHGISIDAPEDEPLISEHFGLSTAEVVEIFGTEGCNDAKTPKAAVKYIRRFIERKVRDARELVEAHDAAA